ncbi:MAG TPA: polyprenyl diphosphate synthase [Gammaproteobacteria bacterium]
MLQPLKHLAIIMDGNGRWAKSRGLARNAGHKAGLESVFKTLQGCERHRIENLTLFAFSSENWRRPKAEVRLLMDLFITTLNKELDKLNEKNVRLSFIGDIGAFEPRLQDSIRQAERRTEANAGLKLTIAANYGGRWDITQAAVKLAEAARAGTISPADVTPEVFSRYISMADSPEPDLLIRTGGECRISNFLNWQLAYTELYFTECLWPDFGPDQLDQAVAWFAGRQRRFGQTPEQVATDIKRLHRA